MRLLRIVENINDDQAQQAGFLSNEFNDEIKIEPNQKLALLNATLSLRNTSLVVDGENSKIEFQFTDATGARTAFMDSAIAYGTNGHQQAAQAVCNTLNDALGCVRDQGNEPAADLPLTGTGNGFNSDISLQWDPNTNGLTQIRWRRGTRTCDSEHWTNKNLTATPAVPSGGNYNNSSLVVDASVDHPGGTNPQPTPVVDENGDPVLDENGDPLFEFPDIVEGAAGAHPMGSLFAKTPWGKGCSQHFCRINDITPADDVEITYADVGVSLGVVNLEGTAPEEKPDIDLTYGVKVCWIDDGGVPQPGIGYPVAVSAGVEYVESFGVDLDPNNAQDIYWIEADHAMNPVVGIFRNFGFFQTLLYVDVYFKYLVDNIGGGASPNGVDFPADRDEAKTMYLQAVPGTPDATLPGEGPGVFGSENAGETEELHILQPQQNQTSGGNAPIDLFPQFNFFSGPPDAGGAATDFGGIKISFVRSTLDPWVALPKQVHLHDPEELALGANTPAPLSNVITSKNFLQLHQEVADYLGFYSKSQRSGFYRDPPGGFYRLAGLYSKKPEDGPNGAWYYTATIKTTNSSQYLNLQVIWKTNPLDCYDGFDGNQSSLLATIPAQVSSNGQIAYEAKNVNAINFRNTNPFSLRNAEVRILTADGNPVLFEGTQTLTIALLD